MKPPRTVVNVIILAGCAALGSCQGYAFEEVLGSSFMSSKIVHDIPLVREVDILFVVDNSGSMAGEQVQLAESFGKFAAALDESFGEGEYRIAVVTTGIGSLGCPPCDGIPAGCVLPGESGKFQDRLGRAVSLGDWPQFEFVTDPTCRVMDSRNQGCFYDPVDDRGVVLVGTTGCGYERGLAAMRRALGAELLGSDNAGFLREEAALAVVMVTDEEDCGEVGDVAEEIDNVRADICYYASKGVGPEGETAHPDAPGKPYRLTPIEDYHRFLVGLKNNRAGLVKFAAITGVTDPADPAATSIEYERVDNRWGIRAACTTPNCEGQFCSAKPGTRYLKLAGKFGNTGFVDTICQESFDETLLEIHKIITCPTTFDLREPVLDPDLIGILINGEEVPRHTCDTPDRIEPCVFGDDATCGQGVCVPTWTYLPPADPPEEDARGGTVEFAGHFRPCDPDRDTRIEVVYVVE